MANIFTWNCLSEQSRDVALRCQTTVFAKNTQIFKNRFFVNYLTQPVIAIISMSDRWKLWKSFCSLSMWVKGNYTMGNMSYVLFRLLEMNLETKWTTSLLSTSVQFVKPFDEFVVSKFLTGKNWIILGTNCPKITTEAKPIFQSEYGRLKRNMRP